jgi:hypothetical protein
LSQVGSDRFSHIGRKRKPVVITSLATYREYTGPPVDIVEFQGDYFACSQPQAGQEKHDCVITTTNRCTAIASMDDPFDFFRLKVPRNFSESPCSHGRNGPSEFTLDLSVPEEKPEEGTEGCHHQLGRSGTTGTGVPQ